MPRRTMPYTLVKRNVPIKDSKPVVIFYYRVRDEDGKLHTFSTGMERKTDAQAHVLELFKQGNLLKAKKKKSPPSIRQYSQDFWKYEGKRVQDALLRKKLTPAYCNSMQGTLERHWLPEFGEKPIDKLTVREIEDLLTRKRKGDSSKGAKPLSTKMVSQINQALKLVYSEAVRLGDLPASPFDKVRSLQKSQVRRGMLTPKQGFLVLSDPNFFESATLWALNLTAATTGARAGELLGLKVKYVFDDYLEIAGVIRSQVGYVKDTKTGAEGFREIPIPPSTAKALAKLKVGKKGDDLIFGELEPQVTSQSINDALENASIMGKAERIGRSIDFHSWRHWYNSMIRGKASDVALRGTTGHLTEEMTENYHHTLPEHVTEVRDAQTVVFKGLGDHNTDSEDASLGTSN